MDGLKKEAKGRKERVMGDHPSSARLSKHRGRKRGIKEIRRENEKKKKKGKKKGGVALN